MKRGEGQRYSCAETVPSNVGTINGEKIEKIDEVVHHLMQTVSFLRHGATAVSSQIIHQKTTRSREKRRCAEIPERQIRAQTVDQHQMRAAAELQVIELHLRGGNSGHDFNTFILQPERSAAATAGLGCYDLRNRGSIHIAQDLELAHERFALFRARLRPIGGIGVGRRGRLTLAQLRIADEGFGRDPPLHVARNGNAHQGEDERRYIQDVKRLEAHAFAEAWTVADEYAGRTMRAVRVWPLDEDLIRLEDRNESPVAQVQSDIRAGLDETRSAQLVQIGACDDRLAVGISRIANAEQFALELEEKWQIILLPYTQSRSLIFFDENGVAAWRWTESERFLPVDHSEMVLELVSGELSNGIVLRDIRPMQIAVSRQPFVHVENFRRRAEAVVGGYEDVGVGTCGLEHHF